MTSRKSNTITYEVPVECRGVEDIVHLKTVNNYEHSDDRFYKVHDQFIADPVYSDAGWSGLNAQTTLEDGCMVLDDVHRYIWNGSAIASGINGIFLTVDADTGVFAENGDVISRLTTHFDSNLVINDISIYSRNDRTASVYMDMKRSNLTADKLAWYEYRLDFFQDNTVKTRVISGLSYPIPYQYMDNKIEYTPTTEFLEIALNYKKYIQDKNIRLDDFLDKCEFIPYERTRVQADKSDNFLVHIFTKFFPIHQHVAVIIEYKDGSLQDYVIDFRDDVDQKSGTIFVRSFNTVKEDPEIHGFHVYYGVIPGVLLNKDTKYKYDHLIESNKDFSLIAIDSDSKYGAERLTNQHVGFNIKNYTEYAETSLYLPARYDNFFVEPDVNIQINGSLVHRNTRKVFTNTELNGLTFSAPDSLLDFMEPVVDRGDNKSFLLTNYIPGSLVSFYGAFQGVRDGSLSLSHAAMSGKIDLNKVMPAFGYSVGPSSYGPYSGGAMSDYGASNTSIVLNVPINGTFSETADYFSLVVNPRDEGYKIVLPAYTIKDEIKVYEIGDDGINTPFVTWEFHNPDILILDRDYCHKRHSYQIVFKPTVRPILERLYVKNSIVTSDSLSKAKSIYGSTFLGYRSLNSRYANVRLGTIRENGSLQYFKQVIRVDMVINKDTLFNTVTKFKHIVLQGSIL